MKHRLIPVLILMFLSITARGYTYDDFVWDFEWLEPGNTVEIGVGESHQQQYACSSNYSIVFSPEMAGNWVHYDFDPFQHVVDPPTGYSINENGVITGLIEGSYGMKPTGLIVAKDGVQKWLWIHVIHKEQPIYLTIKYTEGVSMKQRVIPGESYTYKIEPSSGKQIKWVKFDGMDVSSDITDGKYTTPAITSDAMLEICFE